jgi:hypothetical protein
MDVKESVKLGTHRNIYAAKLICSLTILLNLLLAQGCTINSVSVLLDESERQPINQHEVNLFPTFNEIDGKWQLEGLISVFTLPLGGNSVTKREDLIRATVAGLGIDSVVGMQFFDGFGHPELSSGLLVKTGEDSKREKPKFIVSLLPLRIDDDTKDLLAECVEPNKLCSRLHTNFGDVKAFYWDNLKYYLAYQKGYYTYQVDADVIREEAILQGEVQPVELRGELGVDPDFALLCELSLQDKRINDNMDMLRIGKLVPEKTAYNKSQGSLKVWLDNKTKYWFFNNPDKLVTRLANLDVNVKMKLYDLRQKRVVWSDTATIYDTNLPGIIPSRYGVTDQESFTPDWLELSLMLPPELAMPMRDMDVELSMSHFFVSSYSLQGTGWLARRMGREERSFVVRAGILNALDSLPVVEGFNGGYVYRPDRWRVARSFKSSGKVIIEAKQPAKIE